jgi:hypothetical protein
MKTVSLSKLKRSGPTPAGAAGKQLETISALADVPACDLSVADRETLFEIAERPATPEVQLRAAILLSQIYPTLAPADPDFASRTHTILLRDLREPRKTLSHPSCSWLVMTHLREENMAHIPWVSTEEVASAAECFYGFCEGGLTADESHRRVRDLVKFAGVHFLHQHRYEEVFRLLTRVPVPGSLMDADLFRLRNTLILYEQRRVRRVRRLLFASIVAVVLFIVFCSPILFLAFENPGREKPWSLFDAVYWSIITATTLGYGDIVPQTTAGKLLAACDSGLGVTLTGVIAGFILSHVTPRQLP